MFSIPKSQGQKRHVPPGMMAFSLALAGSVMVTVSVISIIPECLQDDIRMEEEGGRYRMIPFFSIMMVWRVAFFMLGAALYFGLSWIFNVPEPEDLLDSHNLNVLVGNNHTPTRVNAKDVEVVSKQSLKEDNSEIQPFLEDGEKCIGDTSQSTPRIRKSTSSSKLANGDDDPSPGNNNGKHKEKSTSLTSWSTGKDLRREQQKAWRVAMLLFVSLLVHNFPEGLAVAASALESTSLGITVTIGIMIHNIPEGIAIAIPCLAARPDQPWLSFLLASVSGLAEPAGAFVALVCLRGVEKSPDAIMSLENILAFVAGIMIIVALWELFPEAYRNAVDTKRFFWYGTITGIVVMVMTELYLP